MTNNVLSKKRRDKSWNSSMFDVNYEMMMMMMKWKSFGILFQIRSNPFSFNIVIWLIFIVWCFSLSIRDKFSLMSKRWKTLSTLDFSSLLLIIILVFIHLPDIYRLLNKHLIRLVYANDDWHVHSWDIEETGREKSFQLTLSTISLYVHPLRNSNSEQVVWTKPSCGSIQHWVRK